jgi:hypothetical protein
MSWTLDVDSTRTDIIDADGLLRELLTLDQRAQGDPFVAILNAPDGACMCIGLGRPESVLNYIAPGGWPAKHSVGEDVDGLLAYRLAGQISEIPMRCAVPRDQAIEAVLRFFATTTLDERLHWEDD